MKRNKIIETLLQNKLIDYKQRIAFHEAGHAAAIHLNNKARQLPPVFFRIIFKEVNHFPTADVLTNKIAPDDFIARVEGGRLIELLPHSIDSLATELPEHNDAMVQLVRDYRTAFEADIINLLIGPLAEAKYVATTDDEPFNHKLIDLKALKNYGGSFDVALANEYLLSFSANKQQRDNKMAELLGIAFNFVNNDVNWAAITKLADYIRSSSKDIIDCEEIILILDQSVAHFHSRRAMISRQK